MSKKTKFYTELGASIRMQRKSWRISQRELAKKVGINQSKMCRIESGKSGIEAYYMMRIFKTLGMDFYSVRW